MFGSILFALGGLSWTLRADAERAYLTDLLPGLIVGGIGFGFTPPTLISTATPLLASQRFATGSAVVTMTRQIGAVLGVAILIVILDSNVVRAFPNSGAS